MSEEWRPGRGDLNVPFALVGDEPLDLEIQPHVSGGVVVRAAVIDDPSDGITRAKRPVLIFDFHLADGRQMVPVVLVMSRPELLALSTLVRRATDAAIDAARRQSRGTHD